ncbi:MAG TPA: hypothetical protein VG367_05820 [Mucilaginibacter sp.]|nr:hypothetical protein [Mucilaginibacter sp.]
MKKYLLILALTSVFPLLQGCQNFGKEKDYNGVQLYHTTSVTDAEADKLGAYLLSQKFADGTAKTVQLNKSGNTYQFRMVLKDDARNNPATETTMRSFAAFLSSDVFNGAPVEIQGCDERLNTIKTYKVVVESPEKNFNGVQLYHTQDVTGAEADSLGNFLIRVKFATGDAKTVQLAKTGSTYQFRFVVKPGLDKDTAFVRQCRLFANRLSGEIFKGNPVEVQLCDDGMNTLATAQMDKVQSN